MNECRATKITFNGASASVTLPCPQGYVVVINSIAGTLTNVTPNDVIVQIDGDRVYFKSKAGVTAGASDSFFVEWAGGLPTWTGHSGDDASSTDVVVNFVCTNATTFTITVTWHTIKQSILRAINVGAYN